MGRLSAIFVAICMVLIGSSIGAALYLRFGLSGVESAVVAIAVLTGLALFNAVSTRIHDRGDFGGQVGDLARGTADLARQMTELNRRVGALEGKTQAAVEKTLAATLPITAEIGEVGGIIKQMAETVAAHDSQLKGLTPGNGALPPSPAIPAAAAKAPPPVPIAPLVAALSPDVAAKSAEVKSAEVKAAQPVPAEAKPLEPKPFDAKPFDAKPVEPAPSETRNAATKPLELKAADIKPVEATPAETKSADMKPPEAMVQGIPEAQPETKAEVRPADKPADLPTPSLTLAEPGQSADRPAELTASEAKPAALKPTEPKAPALEAAGVKAPEIKPPEPRPAPPAGVTAPRIGSGRFKDMEPAAVIAMIKAAVDANRIDLFLQPIVTLPQRKVRYYEAVARLRVGDGEPVMAADFLPFAEAAGLMPQIDNLMLFRCVQVVRRLLAKNREIGLFCNISASTLADSRTFPQFSEFMEANKAIAPALVFEFTQGALRAMGPIENESLAALAARGYRFSLDNVTDLRIEPRGLAERGFRFLKVQASLLLNRVGGAMTDIHPQDVAGLLARHNIDLIAAKIESEAAVVDLLDYDVKFGQGFLFSPPRPVRPEVMQGVGDRNDVVVREGGVASGAVPGQAAAQARTQVAAQAAAQSGPPAPGQPPTITHRVSSLAQLARGVVARNG
ncbi:MAG TPA: EAL domain-containing protein [Xanthobacteraceae bacterium]|nr:EAL domain-containing protein [Xanthobacteraceae bacterium]